MVFLDCGDLMASFTYTMSEQWISQKAINVMRGCKQYVLAVKPMSQFGDF